MLRNLGARLGVPAVLLRQRLGVRCANQEPQGLGFWGFGFRGLGV